jgi:hypothetical protein
MVGNQAVNRMLFSEASRAPWTEASTVVQRGKVPLLSLGGGGRGKANPAVPKDVYVESSHGLDGTIGAKGTLDYGLHVNMMWAWSAGTVPDDPKMSEVVEETEQTGCFAGMPKANSGYTDTAGGFMPDSHGTPAAVITSPGRRVSNQGFKFRSNKNNQDDVIVSHSGFQLKREVVQATEPGKLKLTTTKTPAGVEVSGSTFTAAAGGAAEATQIIAT